MRGFLRFNPNCTQGAVGVPLDNLGAKLKILDKAQSVMIINKQRSRISDAL